MAIAASGNLERGFPTVATEAVMQQMLTAEARVNEVGIVMATSPRNSSAGPTPIQPAHVVVVHEDCVTLFEWSDHEPSEFTLSPSARWLRRGLSVRPFHGGWVRLDQGNRARESCDRKPHAAQSDLGLQFCRHACR